MKRSDRPQPVRNPSRLRRALGIVAATALAGGLTAAVLQPAHAATIDTTAYYQLVARHSGKALDINGMSTADGAAVIQWTAGTAFNQQFQFIDSGGGFYRLRARHSGKVVEVQGGSTANGATVRQWADTNGTHQQFQAVDTDGGYVKLVNRASGKPLDVWGRSTADGARVSQYSDTGGTNQQWLLRVMGSVTPPTPTTTTTRPPTPTSPPACPAGAPPGSYPNPGAVSGSTGAHDPTAVKTPTGTYLVAVTGNNLPLKTSANRTSWSNAGVVWPGGAPWTTTYTGGSANLWAPDLSFHNGQYYLYYAASTFGSQRSAIFLATSPTGTSGSWTNRGLVIESSTSVNYNAIDPNLVVDQQGQWWLAFGSFWTGIKMIRIDPGSGLRSTTDTAVRAIAQRTTAGGAIEAPTIYYRCGFYYLFVSFDLCCRGSQSTYRIMVGRSTSITGPYTDRNGTAMTAGGGTQILAAHGSVIGPGHQTVLADNGNDVLFYHYYTSSNASFLGINLLGWDSAGWPFVR